MKATAPRPPTIPAHAPSAAQDGERPTLAGDPGRKAKSATSDAAAFTIATYVSLGLLFLAGLLQKGILGPVATGYWSLMQTFWTFFSVASLGAQYGATRQLPAHRGRGDYAGAAAIAGTAGSFSLAMISLVGLLAAAVAILFGAGWAPEMRFGVVLLGVTAPLRYLVDTHGDILQAVKRFDVASLAEVVKAIVTLVAQTLAVYFLGFYGLFLGLVLIELALLAMWLRMGVISRERPAFRLGIDRERLRELIRFGAPIMVWSQVWLLFVAVDSLIVATALNVKQLGYYALAVSFSMYVQTLPRSIGAALSPRMMERFGQTGQVADLRRYAVDVQRLLANTLVPVVVALGYFVVPVLIRHALPEFQPAIPAIKIMVAASFFLALMSMPIKILITAGYRWGLIALGLVCLGLNASLNYLAVVVLEEGIRGAAVATALSYLVTLVATTVYGLSRVVPRREIVLQIAEIVGVFVYLYGALRLLEAVVGTPDGGLVADCGTMLLELGGFLVLMSPWFVLSQRRSQTLSRMSEVMRAAFRWVRRRRAGTA